MTPITALRDGRQQDLSGRLLRNSKEVAVLIRAVMWIASWRVERLNSMCLRVLRRISALNGDL